MPLLIIGVIGIAVGGYYLLSHQQGPGAAQFQDATGVTQARTNGPIPGTTPPSPSTPINATTASIVSTAGATGLGFATMAASSAGVTALGAATLGVGAVIGIGLTLWMGHVQRAKNARDENAVLNQLVPAFSQSLLTEFDALNKKQVSPTTVLQDLEQIRQTYWGAIAPYQTKTGQHTHPCAPLQQSDALNTGEYAPGCYPWISATKQTTPCDKSCTAGCCVGCDYVEPTICAAKAIIMNGGGTIKTHAVGGSKYGYAGQPSFTLSWVQ
jgi:hypothetical protein